MNLKFVRNISKAPLCCNCRYLVNYVQGQKLEKQIREYFYYIDHQGMLFLDDAKIKNFTSCLKDKKFLQFFYTRIKLNDTNRYQNDFPFISVCGREKNYIRCDDVPIVYTHLLKGIKSDTDVVYKDKLSYNYGDDLLYVHFQPHKIFISPRNGRIYHPAWEEVGKIGLIRSKLAIELCKYFEFENSDKAPTKFIWNEKRYELDISWIENTILSNKLL